MMWRGGGCEAFADGKGGEVVGGSEEEGLSQRFRAAWAM